MDLQTPLQELVAKVPGAHGAILIDNQGEAVAHYALPLQNEKSDTERVRLVAAYERIWLSDCLQMMKKIRVGNLSHLIHKYSYGTVLTIPLFDNHALILVTNDETYIGQGLLWMEKCAALIEQDL